MQVIVGAFFLVAVVAYLSEIALLLDLRRRHRHSGNALLVIAVAAAAVWTLAAVAVQTGYRDADGFLDCWPNCTTIQHAAKGSLFWVPAGAIAVLIVVAARRLLTRGRSQREGGGL